MATLRSFLFAVSATAFLGDWFRGSALAVLLEPLSIADVVFRLKWHTGEVRLAVSREMSP